MTKLDKFKNVEKVISRSYFSLLVLYSKYGNFCHSIHPGTTVVTNFINPNNLTIFLANLQMLVHTKILLETKILVYSLANW